MRASGELRATSTYRVMLSKAFRSMTAPRKFWKFAGSPIFSASVSATSRSFTCGHRLLGT